MAKASLERVGMVDVEAQQGIVLHLLLVWFSFVQDG
jgi:hypothetical protein